MRSLQSGTLRIEERELVKQVAVLYLAASLLLAGCASQATDAAAPQASPATPAASSSAVAEATAEAVANCTMLGTVSGVALMSNAPKDELTLAKGAATADAAKKGGTHIVFDQEPRIISGRFQKKSLYVHGKVYRCGG
jgi:hypothetical protein